METESARWARSISPRIEDTLQRHLPVSGVQNLDACMHYALFSGGKRMRPVLAMAAARLVGCPEPVALRLGAAMEYLHTSSLILDDLPCMDNATERRGQPTAHHKFGQGIAVLAAMALLNQTYALLGESELVALACRCIGHQGMVAGQAVDLQEHASVDRQRHYLKTTALFELTLVAPAIAARAPAAAVEALRTFGHCAGMAYQLIDDARDMDEAGTPAELVAQAAHWVDRARQAVQSNFASSEAAEFLCGFVTWLLAGAGVPEAVA